MLPKYTTGSKSGPRNPARGGFKQLGRISLVLAAAALGPALHATDYAVRFTPAWTFVPNELEIQPGDTVQWQNEGIDPQVYDSPELLWDPVRLRRGETFQYTFSAPGNFECHCRDANVYCRIAVVRPAVSTPPQPLLCAAMTAPTNGFQFTVSNLVSGKTFILEHSTNLHDWTPLQTNKADNITATCRQPLDNTSEPHFFRVLALP
jgi:plastocyanin